MLITLHLDDVTYPTENHLTKTQAPKLIHHSVFLPAGMNNKQLEQNYRKIKSLLIKLLKGNNLIDLKKKKK